MVGILKPAGVSLLFAAANPHLGSLLEGCFFAESGEGPSTRRASQSRWGTWSFCGAAASWDGRTRWPRWRNELHRVSRVVAREPERSARRPASGVVAEPQVDV